MASHRMTFANDPAVLRVAAALDCERPAARRVVRALLDVAPAASPWIDGEDIAITTGYSGDAAQLERALKRARLLVDFDGEPGGLVLVAGEAARLGELLREERAAQAEKKRLHREAAIHAAVERDNRGTTGGPLGDEAGTSGGRPGDDRGTTGTGVEPFEGHPGTETGTNGDSDGLASPITRAPGGGACPRGNLPPPTPSATADASTRSAATTSAPSYTGDTSDIPNLDAWLQATLSHHGFTGPSRLTSSQRSELLDAIRAGVSPDAIDGMLDDASSNGARKMTYIRRPLRRAIEQAGAIGPWDDHTRAPPGHQEPTPIDEARFMRAHQGRREGFEDGD